MKRKSDALHQQSDTEWKENDWHFSIIQHFMMDKSTTFNLSTVHFDIFSLTALSTAKLSLFTTSHLSKNQSPTNLL